ncbi:MAG: hypothetical protein COB54_03055 [Alphaproteobacteria bacterium]|nr:MAG: hypothetical protein COB54_03055 [Alphaproteobacteria bacterium]
MFKNYILIALRNMMHNKLYSLINIGGLALGLAVFVFATVLSNYEKTHDMFFDKADRIYTLGSVFSPTANVGVIEDDNVYTTMAPLLTAEVPDIEAIARIVKHEFLLSMGDRKFYQDIKFADKAFLKIFDFDYLAGDSSALDDPSGIVLTETMARKYFPSPDFSAEMAMGQVISLDHKHDLRVTAVIRDVPKNSHFSSSLFGDYLAVVATLPALNKMTGYNLDGNWGNLTSGNLTYVLLPAHLDAEWLERQANGVFDRHASDYAKDYLTGLKSHRLQDVNLVIWDMLGLPVIEGMVVLGFLVLIIAGLNYTNLATAQAMGRAKEVGLRKTMGASRGQLLTQFLIESMAIAMIAMLVALAMLEMIIPVFNDSMGKIVSLEYSSLLPSLMGVTFLVGLIAGLYPAYVIIRATPVDALNNALGTGSKGSFVRSCMMGAQFVISIVMLAMVAVVSFQNEKMKESSEIYPKSQIVTLQRLGVDDLQGRLETLQREMNTIPEVENVTFSSRVPFEQGSWTFDVTKNSGDVAAKVSLHRIAVEYDFLKTYDIPLIAGRDFSRDFANDLETRDSRAVNVILNELALKKIGFASAEDALNKSFYQVYGGHAAAKKSKAYVIVGVMADQNFLGLHNDVKPFVFRVDPRYYYKASIRIKGQNLTQTMEEINDIWQKINPDYPIQVKFLDEIFDMTFKRSRAINMVLAGFAVMALTLAFVGLFGLSAFMAERRTKEIGLRKVMGAKTHQIVLLLIWQFSRPVLWALALALPLAYLASDAYLTSFADRINLQMVLIAGSGLVALVLSWLIVSAHAVRVARRKPITALRYE